MKFSLAPLVVFSLQYKVLCNFLTYTFFFQTNYEKDRSSKGLERTGDFDSITAYVTNSLLIAVEIL